MANARGIVRFEAGGDNYKLQFTTNAWCELEDQAGAPMGEFLVGLGEGGLSFRRFRLLIWAGLIEHHPNIDLRGAGALIDQMGGVAKISPLVEEAVLASVPEAEPGEGAEEAGKARGAA